MADIFDVSKEILKHYSYGISTRKLQKLAYFSQGWVLALTGKPLFEEDFEAWQFGPVSRSLYCRHRGAYSITDSDLPLGDATNLNRTESVIVGAVLRNYGSLSGDELSDMTHAVGTPWQRIRQEKGVQVGKGSSEIIPKDLIQAYFRNILRVES
ncbi:Panacea domain-containing protein [Canibacter zhoujuaniae]|uniref:Panacea domain-containing protein n=1 Tax=Canibacter zhoujuaniae TaxID=2708343 RepID=UPI0014206FAC|nr:type II toxin-antitoxin system antitoxin SocA domain-containing protein [Canibacter zhoujuaniae]